MFHGEQKMPSAQQPRKDLRRETCNLNEERRAARRTGCGTLLVDGRRALCKARRHAAAWAVTSRARGRSRGWARAGGAANGAEPDVRVCDARLSLALLDVSRETAGWCAGATVV